MIFYKAFLWEFILISNIYNFRINIVNKKFILGVFFILTLSLKTLDYKYFFVLPMVLIAIQVLLFKVNNNVIENILLVSIIIALFGVNKFIVSKIVWNIPSLIDGLPKSHYKYIIIFRDILVAIVCFIESKFLGNKINKISLTERFKKNHYKFLGTIIVAILNIGIVLYINSTIGSRLGIKKCIKIMSTDIFMFYLLFNFLLLYFLSDLLVKRIQYKQKIKNLSSLNEYTKTIENLYTDINKMKHDYSNIILTISGYLDSSDLDGLKRYFNSNILKYNNSFNKKINRLPLLYSIKLLELKGIVSSKLLRAYYKNIDINISIIEEIDFINMDIMDLCRIIGILLDNAIEACEKHSKPKINFSIIKNRTSILLCVGNNYVEPIGNIHEMFKSGFSTKGSNRGVGLYILEEIVSRYNNVFIETRKEKDEFVQVIIVDNEGADL